MSDEKRALVGFFFGLVIMLVAVYIFRWIQLPSATTDE